MWERGSIVKFDIENRYYLIVAMVTTYKSKESDNHHVKAQNISLISYILQHINQRNQIIVM